MSTDEQGNEIGKLFVGGLHQLTETDNLKNYFSQFGDVIEGSVMMDHKTGRSRGFGYIRYSDNEAVQKVMSIKHHLDGKDIDPKPCNVNMKGRSRRSLKIFVGGIAPEHNEETLKDFFKQFGTITELTLMRDQSGHRHRGFAFVAFDDESVVKQLISDHFLQIGNKQVEIKPMEQQINRNGNDMIGNNRGLVLNPMQGNQWPQWTSTSPAGWPSHANWGAWTQTPAGNGVGPTMWDQGPSGWGGPTSWGTANSNVSGLVRGPEMMTAPWDAAMWNGTASANMQYSQTNNNGYVDPAHSHNPWSSEAYSGGFGMPTNTSSDWKTAVSNGVNPHAPMRGQPFGSFKKLY